MKTHSSCLVTQISHHCTCHSHSIVEIQAFGVSLTLVPYIAPRLCLTEILASEQIQEITMAYALIFTTNVTSHKVMTITEFLIISPTPETAVGNGPVFPTPEIAKH